MMQVEFDPISNRFPDDPYPVYKELRDHAPVHYANESDCYVVSRYEDIEHVLKTPEVFSSKLDQRRQMPGGRAGRMAQLRASASMLVRLRVAPWTAARSRFLIGVDGAEHAAMRSIVSRGFTPRRITAWEKRARELAAEGVERLRSGERFDLVHDLAVPLPVTMIAEILGVGSDRMHDFKRWSDAFITGGTGSGVLTGDSAPLFEAMAELRNYLRPIVLARRANSASNRLQSGWR